MARKYSQRPSAARPASSRAPAPRPEVEEHLIGAHISTSGGVHKVFERCAAIGCAAAQIFVKNNMQWMAPPFSSAELRSFEEHRVRSDLRVLFGHSGYLINIAATGPNRVRSIESLTLELGRAEQLGLPFLVLHPGAHLGLGEAEGLALAARALDEVFAAHPRGSCRIALETTAGQGSCLGHELEHLVAIREKVSQPERVCYCVDTAHIFAAGYDLSSEESTRKVFTQIQLTLGLDLLVAIHMNDSKTPLGSRVDRHEHIGKGKIGLAAFAWIMREPCLAGIAKVLETPKGRDMAEDVVNLATLRELAEGDRVFSVKQG